MNLLTRKLRRDISSNTGQFALMAAAVFLSVFALMTLIGALASIQKATATAYMSTNPAQATIETDGSTPLPENLAIPGATTERRGSVLGRIADSKGNWHPFLIFIIEDFSKMQIGKSFADKGKWPPPEGSIAMERTALELIEKQAGNNVDVILPGTSINKLFVTGAAHDPGLAPAWQERTGYGYMSLATARSLFGKQFELSELKLVFADNSLGMPEIRTLTDQTATMLESKGFRIEEIQVPPLRTHPHQSQMNTILTIFLSFSVLALILSGILLATMLRSFLVRETRSIGIMKTLGASPRILLHHYLGMSLVPAFIGTLLALPLGLLAASGLTDLIVNLLNFGTGAAALAWWVIPVPLAGGLLVPLVLTLIPVLSAIRLPVRSALEGPRPPRPRLSVSRIRLPRSLALVIRNLGRRPGSLALTLILLACGGFIFMTALNITSGWEKTLKLGSAGKNFDLEIRLDTPVDQSAALLALKKINGITTIESWPRMEAYPASEFQHPLTGQYPDRGHGSFYLRSMPETTTLITQTIVSGTPWLLPKGETGRAIILNQNALALFPRAIIGKPINLIINGKPELFILSAVAREIGPATAWVRPIDYPANKSKQASPLSNSFYIAMDTAIVADHAAFENLTRTIETTLTQLGGLVEMSLPEAEFDAALGGHVMILIVALAAMAVVIGLVGLLGLSATMGASVLDRTREIGIMRAIGATPSQILRLILGEAGVQAIIGLLLALILSIPSTIFLGNVIGMMSFRIPLETSINPVGMIVCIIALPLGSILAAASSARQASRTSVRTALAYE